MRELQELEQIVEPEKGRGTPKEHIQSAIQLLLHHQILYEDTYGAKRAMEVIRAHRPFFEKYFDAAGRKLVIERREGMIALMPGAVTLGAQEARIAKDEAVVLFALRYILETGLRSGQITETGRVESSTDELHDALRTVAGDEPPPEARLRSILKGFERRGLVRLYDRNPGEKVTPMEVLPGTRLICSDEFAKHIVSWAETAQTERATGGIFVHIAEARADEEAERLEEVAAREAAQAGELGELAIPLVVDAGFADAGASVNGARDPSIRNGKLNEHSDESQGA